MPQNKDLSPMQQELLNRADAIFDSVGKAVTTAGEFVAGQVPDIATQYVAYGRAWTTCAVVLGILLLIFAIWMVKKMFSTWDSPDLTPIAMVPISAGFLLVSINFKEFLLVWFAPKVWLLQEIVHLVKA